MFVKPTGGLSAQLATLPRAHGAVLPDAVVASDPDDAVAFLALRGKATAERLEDLLELSTASEGSPLGILIFGPLYKTLSQPIRTLHFAGHWPAKRMFRTLAGGQVEKCTLFAGRWPAKKAY